MISRKQLIGELRALGVSTGDAVMIHASLRAVGPMENRAAGLVQSLIDAIGSEGALLAYVDYEPTPEQPYFDPDKSPACKDYGVLAEIIRTWPGASRSNNPGASMAAIGKKADWFCSDHPINYGYGENTPLARLVEMKGKVLLLGSDLDQVTLLHYAEARAQLPSKRVIRAQYQIMTNGALRSVQAEEFDTSAPVLDDMPEQYFEQITQEFIERGGASSGTVGQAQSYLLPAREFVEFAIEKMEREYGTSPHFGKQSRPR
jgi:aminoglycoside 3-N-acetyltransferase